MKQAIPLLAFLSVAPLSLNAAPMYDQDVTSNIIFGSGVDNGGFTVDRNNDVELGLRAKLRHNASGDPENTFNSNGDGTYSFDAGSAPTQSPSTAIWNFEWSINSSWTGETGRALSDLNYEIGIGFDLGFGLGPSFLTFDPINILYQDHAIGTNATGNGDGTVGTLLGIFGPSYYSLINNNNLAQNSWKPHQYILGFDPTLDGIYNFYLSASDAAGTVLAHTSMQVRVGNVATATVPVPAPLTLFGLGLLALGLLRRRKA